MANGKNAGFWLPQHALDVLQSADNRSATVALALRHYETAVDAAVARLLEAKLLAGVLTRALQARDAWSAVEFVGSASDRAVDARLVAEDIQAGGILAKDLRVLKLRAQKEKRS